jgi:hypothetical protein
LATKMVVTKIPHSPTQESTTPSRSMKLPFSPTQESGLSNTSVSTTLFQTTCTYH